MRHFTHTLMALVLSLISLMPASGVKAATSDPDLPPSGRSRFDQLIGDKPVPFPFQRLIQRINAQLETDAGLPPIKAVLIPLGRSLQRAAGAPEFFKYPRVVVAIDGDTKPGIPPMRDRLFIGYHEKGALLEVISYNEAAGRFEFQLVRDYRAGQRPQVFYARRSLCLACHQNEAPLFSRPLWDETPANPAIAARLKAEERRFYGVPLAGTDIAYFIDNATDRANLLSVWQRIWREGCGDGKAGDDCRRELFAAALAFGLSGALQDKKQLASLAKPLDRNWLRHWPGGLAIPNPDIPNRDPFAFVPDASAPPSHRTNTTEQLTELKDLAHIPARFEPLNPRPPLEVWLQPEKARLIAGLAGMLAKADLDALDRALAARPFPIYQRLELNCRLRDKGAGLTSFACNGDAIHLQGTIQRRGNRMTGRIDRLTLAGAPTDIELQGLIKGPATTAHATLQLHRHQRHARLADGQRLVTFELREGASSLTLADDFNAVKAALTGLKAIETARTFPAWDGMAAFLTALGAKPTRAANPPLPPPRSLLTKQADDSSAAADFYRYCGECHNSPEPFPPNFLDGDAHQVTAQLSHCAPRIFYRLKMWDVAEPLRGKTPMPPLPALAHHRLNAASWTRSAQREHLLQHARRLLADGGQNAEALLQQPFENLPPCLPSASAQDAGRNP